jgi:hypothetical protein
MNLPPAPPTGAAAWPELGHVFEAVPDLAWGVAAGLLTLSHVENAVVYAAPVQAAWRARYPETPFRSGTLITDLVWAIRASVARLDRERANAEEAVAKEVAPLLDRSAPREHILAAAHDAASGLLTPVEVERIVDRERAWWVRLHAATLLRERQVA